jgi:hypothetical protein
MPAINKSKYIEISRKISEMPLDKFGSTYQWEELVQKMCASKDAGLQQIGIKELGELKKNKR